MWKLRKFSLTIFWQKFRETTVLLNKLLKSCFHEIFFRWKRIPEISTVFIVFTRSLQKKSTIKREHYFNGKINIFSVKSTFLLDKEVTKEFISRKTFCAWSRLSYFFTLCSNALNFTNEKKVPLYVFTEFFAEIKKQYTHRLLFNESFEVLLIREM